MSSSDSPPDARYAATLAKAHAVEWGNDINVALVAELSGALEACVAELAALERQITAMLAASSDWQRDAQTLEEKAWANVFRASLTHAAQEAGRVL